MSEFTVNFGGNVFPVEFYDPATTALLARGEAAALSAEESAGDASDFADTASNAANAASAAANYFSSLAAGEAGTATGQLFSYPDGAGGLVYRERTVGGSIEVAHFTSSEAPTTIHLENIATPVVGEMRQLQQKGRFGWFKFFSAALYAATFGATLTVAVAADTAQGVHVAPASDATGASGAWVREQNGWISAENFGFVAGDYATGISADCVAAWDAMQAYFDVVDRNVSAPFVANAPKVFFSGAQYCFSTKIVINRAMHLIGSGAGALSEACWFRWTTECTGIVINRGGSTYAGEVSANTGGGGTIIEGILFQGAGGTPTGSAADELLYSAIRVKDRATIKNCKFRNWRGVGVCISADTGAAANNPFRGNINGTIVDDIRVEGCKYGGVWVSGGDANVINLKNADVSQCGRFGFWISPFLGVVMDNCQVAHCGTPTNSGLAEYSLVHYAGVQYYALWSATTATLQGEIPGTGSNWIYYSAGGPSADIPTWTGAHAYVPGGSYGGTGDFATLTGCYHELGQGLPQLPGATLIGGFMGSGVSDAPQIYGGLAGIGSNKPFYQKKAYIDASTVTARLGGTMGNTWADVVGFQSSAATAAFDPDRFTSFAVEKATGDLGFRFGAGAGQFEAGQVPIVRFTGYNTGRTYGGRSQAECRDVLEVKNLALGDANNARIFTAGSAAPAAGFHALGERVFNDGSVTPLATVDHWRCDAAGTPGTWTARA